MIDKSMCWQSACTRNSSSLNIRDEDEDDEGGDDDVDVE